MAKEGRCFIRSKNNRPATKKPIDKRQLLELARIHCTMEEMARVMGVTMDTLRDSYSEIINEGRAEGCASVRRKQFEVAMTGHPGMLIWLGKIWLGQKESIVVSSAEPEVRELLRKWGAAGKKGEKDEPHTITHDITPLGGQPERDKPDSNDTV